MSVSSDFCVRMAEKSLNQAQDYSHDAIRQALSIQLSIAWSSLAQAKQGQERK